MVILQVGRKEQMDLAKPERGRAGTCLYVKAANAGYECIWRSGLWVTSLPVNTSMHTGT